MIDIVHRRTNAILYHSEAAQTIAEAAQEAVKNFIHLDGALLDGASLDGASLRGASLRGAKGYVDSHDFFAATIRRQPLNTFSVAEWSAIGRIVIYRPCWGTIQQRYADVAPHVFAVLAEAGFTEWQEHWITISREGEHGKSA